MCKCKICGEGYSKADIRELKLMGEDLNRLPFICPDCWDDFQRLDSEAQMELLFNNFRQKGERVE